MALLSSCGCSLRTVINKEIMKRVSPLFLQLQHRTQHSKKSAENEDSDMGPLRFSRSGAESWQAKSTRSGGSETMPWFQPYVISLSLTVFLVYFCILREENDIDEELGKTLYDRIEGLEQKQLELSLEYNKAQGLDTKDIEARLAELDQEKIDGY